MIGGLGLEEGNSAADFYASYYNDHVRGISMRFRGKMTFYSQGYHLNGPSRQWVLQQRYSPHTIASIGAGPSFFVAVVDPPRSALRRLNVQHFHYSYVINAAAVLAHLRPSWATSDTVAWVNTLIRDVNDPNKVPW